MFERAFDIVLGHEGGYVNDPRDPGGETKYGISKRAYPKENIKELTIDRAKEIYKRDYWDACKCSAFDAPVAICLFDAAVNHGVKQASKFLQRVANVKDDGIIGPQTIKAVKAIKPHKVVTEFQKTRVRFYRQVKNAQGGPAWLDFGEGWAVRALDVLSQALA